ncbi:MAG: hypothetical protein ACJ8FY_23705 [Gemmataceae bacterium]
MDRELMEIVLPRLARRLYKQLEQYRLGEMNHSQFSQHFETLLQRQYAWLSKQGVPESQAAIAIHAGVLVLSGPGLRAEAEQDKVPLELVEFKAVRMAAEDIARNYGIPKARAIKQISSIVAQYAE